MQNLKRNRSKISAKLLICQQFLNNFRQNNGLELKNRSLSKNNKRYLRADVLSLLSSALRPRLLRDQSTLNYYIAELKNVHIKKTIFGCNRGKFRPNVAKIVALSTILSVSGLFSVVCSSSSVFADSLTLTIPSSPLSLDLNPFINNGFATTSGSFNVKTINSSGYTVSIKTKNEVGDNSLISGENKLNSITEATTEDNFKSDPKFINMWGWLPSKLNSEDNTNYQIAPGVDEVVLDKTEEANETGTDYSISLAAKVANDTPTGKYENTFVISATSNELPPDGIMQEWDGCDSLGLEQSVRLLDNRDNNVYTVTKLRDGKCWMTENLRISGDSVKAANVSTTLDSTNTDISDGNNFTIPDSDISKFNVGSFSSNSNEWKDSNAVYVDDVSYQDSNYGVKNFESGYYTWYTATAGTGDHTLTSSIQEAAGSICPKGWRLPKGGSSSEFRALTIAYSVDDNATGSNILRGAPLNFTYAGVIEHNDGALRDQGIKGFYWSSTVNTEPSADYLLIGSSDVRFNVGNRPYGHSMRCVQNKSMQKVSEWYDDVQTDKTVVARDERDGSTYTVAKLKDGELWMTQNLRITGSSSFKSGYSTTLTSDDTDLPDGKTFELPISNISKFNVSSFSTSSNEWKDNDATYYYNTIYGAYYTWHTATAGTGDHTLTSSIQEAAGSICPKGWRLPKGGSNGDFQALATAYNIGNNTAGSNTLRGSPLNFTHAGYVNYGNGSMSDLNISGNYWSSTAYNQYLVYALGFGNSSVMLINNSNRPSGYSVRCVARRPKTISDLQYMQDWGDLTNDEKTQVLNSMEEGTQYTLTDNRDNTQYTVAKLKDGKLWMTQNLTITGSSSFQSGHSATLTSNDSDVSNNYTIPTSDISKFNLKGVDSSTTQWKENNAAYVTTTSYTDLVHGAKSFESGYYTWYTATAGTGTADQATRGWNAPSSICPKGWKLPTSRLGGDFQTLTNAYSISSNGTDGSNTLRGAPLNFTYAGAVGYSDGSMKEQGSNGYYWSSTVYTDRSAYYLYFLSGGVNHANGGFGRPSGRSVRCVARDKERKIIYDAGPSDFCGLKGVPDPQTIPQSEANVTLSEQSPETNCHKLKEWCTVEPVSGSCPGETYQPGQTISLPEDDITLYAIWENKSPSYTCTCKY